MKKLKILFGTVILSAGLASCSSAYYASAGYASDDLYAVHDRAEISRRKQAEAEAQRAAAEARRAEWEARIAEAKAAAAENSYYEYRSADANPYESVLADDYESAYARRLRGFESPTYKMPSSYINARYGSAFNYVSAYDPAFYNIVVMGDQVWVEPKYITSMFGSWGTVIYSDPWYYGWNRPWGPSFSFGSWGWSFGWNSWHNPWYGPGWGPWYSSWYDPWYGPGWGWGPGWHGHHHVPGWGPGWHGRPYHSNIVRVGAEFKPLPVLSLRAGFGYSDSMVRDDEFPPASPVIKQTTYYGAGVGFVLSRGVLLDLAYQYVSSKLSDYYLFYAEDKVGYTESALYSTDINRHNVALTLGFRF